MHKIVLKNGQSPGDVVMMAHAIKAIHEQHPGKFQIGYQTSSDQLFEGSPYVDHELKEGSEGADVIVAGYPTVHMSNQKPYHFVTGYVYDLSRKLGIHLEPTEWGGAIHIQDAEKAWFSAPREITGQDYPYWVIDAGHKTDFTAKAWDFKRYQEVVDRNQDILFVQVGLLHPDHVHPPLKGHNVINLIGRTDQRQLVRLVWNAFGVLTPVSFPMVLSYSIHPHPRYKRKSRACVVIAGGREPNHWQQPPNSQFLHTCGQLICCDHGGCWKSRVVPLGGRYADEKDQSLCLFPERTPAGQPVARCMNMITTDEVCNAIRRYHDNLDYPHQWSPASHRAPGFS